MDASSEPIPPHRIERTRNRSSSARLLNGEIVIRLAGHLTTAEEQRHISSLLRRMARVAVRERQLSLIDPFHALLQGDEEHILTFCDGRTRIVRLQSGTRTIARLHNGIWTVDVGPHTKRNALHRLLWKMIAKSEQGRVELLAETINANTMKVKIRTIRLRYMSSRWGSCSMRGAITLNTALLFTSPEILEYVIVHELAHRLHPNHSKHFWAAVNSVLPNAEKTRKHQHRFRLQTIR